MPSYKETVLRRAQEVMQILDEDEDSASDSDSDTNSDSDSDPNSNSVKRTRARATNINHYVPALDGIRGLMLMWVVMFHTMFFAGAQNLTRQDVTMMTKSMMSSLPIVGNGHMAVDGFFVLSGFLIGRGFLHSPIQSQSQGQSQSQNRAKTTVICKFLLRRIFRIVPSFYVTLGIYCFAVSFMDGGGVRQCGGMGDMLRNLLFYQNTFPFTEQCLAYGWSLSVEIHFYLAACVIMVVMNWGGCRCVRVVVVVGCLVASLIARYTKASELELKGNVFSLTVMDVGNVYFSSTFYANTQFRVFACFLGLLGSFITTFDEQNNGFSRRRCTTAGTIVSAAGRIRHDQGGSGGETVGGGSTTSIVLNTKAKCLAHAGALAFIGAVVVASLDYAGITTFDEPAVILIAFVRPLFCLLLTMVIVGCVIMAPIIAEAKAEEPQHYSRRPTIHVVWGFLLKLLNSKILSVVATLSYPGFLLHPLLILGFYMVNPFSAVPSVLQLLAFFWVNLLSTMVCR